MNRLEFTFSIIKQRFLKKFFGKEVKKLFISIMLLFFCPLKKLSLTKR